MKIWPFISKISIQFGYVSTLVPIGICEQMAPRWLQIQRGRQRKTSWAHGWVAARWTKRGIPTLAPIWWNLHNLPTLVPIWIRERVAARWRKEEEGKIVWTDFNERETSDLLLGKGATEKWQSQSRHGRKNDGKLATNVVAVDCLNSDRLQRQRSCQLENGVE